MAQRGPKPTYILTEERRQLITERYDGRQGKKIAAEIGVPDHVVRIWAKRLGIVRKAAGTWTQVEEAYLRANIGDMPMKQLSKTLHRSVDAVKSKCDRLDLSYATYDDDGYSLTEVAEGLGREQDDVMRWMKGRKKRGVLCFSDNEIRRFLQEHPEQVSKEVLNSLWVRDLLHSAGGMGSLARDCE
jgi:transposase